MRPKMSGTDRVIRFHRKDWKLYEKQIRYWARHFNYDEDDAVQEAAISHWNTPAKYFVIDLVRFAYKEPCSRYLRLRGDTDRPEDFGSYTGDPDRTLDIATLFASRPPRDSDLLQRFFYRGESAQEIAASEGTTYDHVHYALEQALKKAARFMRRT